MILPRHIGLSDGPFGWITESPIPNGPGHAEEVFHEYLDRLVLVFPCSQRNFPCPSWGSSIVTRIRPGHGSGTCPFGMYNENTQS